MTVQIYSCTRPPRAAPDGLLWRRNSRSIYALRARHWGAAGRYPEGVYAVACYRGRHGRRWLCWWFPQGVHRFDRDGRRCAGGPPDGLFAMRRSEAEAMADAVHHARTGEIRP